MDEAYSKPLPVVTPLTKPFWEACMRHELLIQKCVSCHQYIWEPRHVCPFCLSRVIEWIRSAGKGKVFSYSVIYRPRPEWINEVPYTLAVIKLEEGVNMVSNIVECSPSDVRIGMPVEVVFEDVTSDFTLFKFVPTERNRLQRSTTK